ARGIYFHFEQSIIPLNAKLKKNGYAGDTQLVR
ncbi:uncharacterized protein METZ01_LOCUS187832, partial [marine metagenome]